MYKLIALDMDGTLLRNDGSISERTQQAIAAAKALGVKVVLASGRPIAGMEKFLQQLTLTGHEDYVLSYNGSLVQNVGSGEVLASRLLTGLDARYLATISQQLGVNIHAFSEPQGLIAPRNSRYTELERSHNDLVLTELDFASLPDDEPILKVMMVDEPEILAQAVSRLPPEVYQRYTVVQSTPYFLEFLHPQSNKGSGVAALAEHPQAELDELAAIYVQRGLDPALASRVAEQLTAHDALGAHLRDELHLSELHAARPLQAAFASATAFAVGATPPILLAWLAPGGGLSTAIIAMTLVVLALLGAIAGRLGGASMAKGAVRVVFWGALAMAATAMIGRLFGAELA